MPQPRLFSGIREMGPGGWGRGKRAAVSGATPRDRGCLPGAGPRAGPTELEACTHPGGIEGLVEGIQQALIHRNVVIRIKDGHVRSGSIVPNIRLPEIRSR